MPSPLPQLWLVITRPNTLPAALAAADALADRFPGGCRLLLENSSWWRHTRWEEYRARFAAVHAFERIPAPRGLFDIARLHRQFAERQRVLRALPFAADHDVLLCLAGVTKLANAASSAYRPARRVLCLPLLAYDALRRPPNRWRYRFTTESWVQNRLIEPLVGLESTLHLKPRLNRGGDGVRLVRLRRAPEEVYGAVVVMSNTGDIPSPGTTPRTFPARFPDLSELDATVSCGAAPVERRRMVFFGTPFLLVENLPPARYAARLNACLDYLRRSYPDCAWTYRPHPAETTEVAQLQLDGFEVETDGEVAELYFLQNFRRLAAVFSVSSTVSRVALNSGLDAYSLWRCFPFAETQRQFFEKTMGTVPPEFDVRDLSAPPEPYAARRRTNPSPDKGPSFGEALRTALDAVPSHRASWLPGHHNHPPKTT